jgi:hypothetical protein
MVRIPGDNSLENALSLDHARLAHALILSGRAVE